MKEITVLSGKGGAGKTTITAALASIAENTVFCDNDVDAADLHLILKPEIIEEHTFYSSWLAFIDEEKCSDCGLCKEICRFDAIHYNKNGNLEINPYQCEGCRLCERICPETAITSERNSNNRWYISNTRFGKLVHARMGPGEENSGKLVTKVRKRAMEIAKETNADFIINDGPPGIGCATISSITGANTVLIVIEPSKSGLHDAKRLIELAGSFKLEIVALINKYDISTDLTKEIIRFLKKENIPLLGKIPFNREMTEAMVEEKSFIEYNPESEASHEMQKLWERIKS